MPAVSVGIRLEEVLDFDAQGPGQFFQHVDGRTMLLAFDVADVVAVNVCTGGQLLLRNALSVSHLSQVLGDDRAHFHARKSPRPLVYYHPVYWGFVLPVAISSARSPAFAAAGVQTLKTGNRFSGFALRRRQTHWLPWVAEHKKAPAGFPDGAFGYAGLLAVGFAGAGPDQRVALAVLIVEQVGEDRRIEAGVIQFDREVIAALVGAFGPGGPDLGLMRSSA